ncbi:coiled-coil domain-containing protein 174 [Trichogramma pretiosum]|uniref:coiled-coil domain-containing protein 174 n=1 Tax=Trichogramma pretiosum TaxID=7493 RepID=UPI0006C96187|nr:coiled-coil domain-containing protein 174 [Trichogramma pretiosum]
MNGDSKITVHHSSLLGLKAELLRKQAEVKEAKQRLHNFPRPKEKIVKPKEEIKIETKAKKRKVDETDDVETLKAMQKSKLMLEAKSQLYEKLTRKHCNMNPNFLVDFENKVDDHIDERVSEDDVKSDDYDSDDGWVEYTDCFGRTRKCLREDLPKMKDKDKHLRSEIGVNSPPREEEKKKLYYEDKTPNREPEIEIMRRKWEEQTAKLADKTDIHYQDVLFDEARNHGVGYYAFSADEEERKKQQENLFKLRKETEKQQEENKRIKEMKKQIVENRLKVARARARMRKGLPAEETEEEKSANQTTEESKPEENEENNESSVSKDGDKDKEEPVNKLVEIENKVKAYGELLTKGNKWYVMTQEEWVKKKRQERPNEFAPVYENFHGGGTLHFGFEFGPDRNETCDPTEYPAHPSKPAEHTETEIPSNDLPLEEDPDLIGPLPPPTMLHTDTAAVDENIEDKVEAGLKFLRQQFESNRSATR